MPPPKNRVCCVPKCKASKDDKGIKLIKFPTDKRLQKKWAIQVGPDFCSTGDTFICSKHFVSGKRTYTEGSIDYIPSIFPSGSGKDQKVSCLRSRQDSESVTAIKAHVEKPTTSSGTSTSGHPSANSNKNVENNSKTPEIVHADSAVDGTDDVDKSKIPVINLEENEEKVSSTDGTGASINSETFSKESETYSKSKSENPEVDMDSSAIAGESTTPEKKRNRDILCFAPECNNKSSTPGIEMYPFPTEKGIQRNWAKRLKLDRYATIPGNAKICSWHFTDGLKNGPIRFHWNEGKSFDLNFPRTTRKRSYRNEVPVVATVAVEPESQPNGLPIPPVEPRPKPRVPVLKRPKKDDEFLNCSMSALKNEITRLREATKVLKNKLKNCEKETNAVSTTDPQIDLKQWQDRWISEKTMVLEANFALANCVKKEQAARVALEEKLKNVGQDHALKHNLRYENCLDDLEYFTALPSKHDFENLYKLLAPLSKGMIYWHGKFDTEKTTENQSQPKVIHRIDHRNHLFLALSRYRRGFTSKELAFFFGVEPLLSETIFITFAKLLESELIKLFLKSYQVIQENIGLPEPIRTNYPNLYAVMGSMEIYLDFRSTVSSQSQESPENLATQVHPVYKIEYLCTPAGKIIYISNVYSDGRSDREIAIGSNVFDEIPVGSELFVHQEFEEFDECKAKKIQLKYFPIIEPTPSDDTIKLEVEIIKKCEQRMRNLVESIQHFRVFRDEFASPTNPNIPLILRSSLLYQNYIDTHCAQEIESSTDPDE